MTDEHGLPIVRACQVARLSRAAYYKPGINWATWNGEVIAALQAIVLRERRGVFWKWHHRLFAQGYGWNHKRTWRVYCQLRLNLPRRTKRRVAQRVRQQLLVEPRMNAVWAIDFMRDTLYSGRVFRTLNLIDEVNRGALGIELRIIQPGRPDQNAYIERFNRTYREDVLSAYLFDSLDEVREFTAEWLDRYNEIRPLDALGSLPPALYREHLLRVELQIRTVH